MMAQNMAQRAQGLGRVAVLMGGCSGEREVSLMSGKAVLDALLSAGVDAVAFDPSEQKLSQLKLQGVERCFNALHGAYGEDGGLQAELEVLEIPYTGSGVMTSALAMDKVLTKKAWMQHNIPTAPFEVVEVAKLDQEVVEQVLESVGLPLVVKPVKEGSSIGVFKVFQADELLHAIGQAGKYDGHVLCEKMVQGDEVTCAVVGTGSRAKALPIVRIVAPQGNYDYEHKYFKDDTQYECPANIAQAETEQLQSIAVKAYQVLNARGCGRIDVMIDEKTRQPYLLELNTSPGMTSHSLVPMAARAAGCSMAEFCVQMLEDATLDSRQAG